MEKKHALAYFLEDLWSKGFKLSDEDVRFIYFGKNSTNASEWKTIIAVRTTLKVQQNFDPSFYISILELIAAPSIRTKRHAYRHIDQRLSVGGSAAKKESDLNGPDSHVGSGIA